MTATGDDWWGSALCGEHPGGLRPILPHAPAYPNPLGDCVSHVLETLKYRLTNVTSKRECLEAMCKFKQRFSERKALDNTRSYFAGNIAKYKTY